MSFMDTSVIVMLGRSWLWSMLVAKQWAVVSLKQPSWGNTKDSCQYLVIFDVDIWCVYFCIVRNYTVCLGNLENQLIYIWIFIWDGAMWPWKWVYETQVSSGCLPPQFACIVFLDLRIAWMSQHSWWWWHCLWRWIRTFLGVLSPPLLQTSKPHSGSSMKKKSLGPLWSFLKPVCISKALCWRVCRKGCCQETVTPLQIYSIRHHMLYHSFLIYTIDVLC